VAAIEGAEELFRCDQILDKGPGEHAGVDYRQSCAFAQAMRGAELAWRRELAGRTVADVRAGVEHRHPESPADTRARIAELR
jgi:DNA-binding IscR family transcriptional regulator